MIGSKYNAHTEPLLKQLNILKLEDSFSLHCLKLYYKFITSSLPKYFTNFFPRNNEFHSYGTQGRDQLHYFPFRKIGASKCIRHSVLNLLTEIAPNVRSNLNTLSLEGFSFFYKTFVVNAYDPGCQVHHFYICNNHRNLPIPVEYYRSWYGHYCNNRVLSVRHYSICLKKCMKIHKWHTVHIVDMARVFLIEEVQFFLRQCWNKIPHVYV